MGPEQMVEPDDSNHQHEHQHHHQHQHQHQHQDRKPLDSKYIWGLVWQHKRQLLIAALSSLFAVACTLASPVITGYLFEALAGRQPASLYPKLLALLALQYTMEPLLSKVFISTAISTAERVVHSMRREVFRVLLLQKIEFWDRHNAADMTALLSKELDTVRAFVFSNVSRDRGIRACLESLGAVAILGALSWRLGPVLALVVVSTAAMAALYRRSTHKVEAVNNRAQRRMNQIADEAFKNIRTVRSFAGEPQERERYESYSRESLEAGLVFARAKGWLEASNRGTIHVSLLLLFALGGWLITHNLLPLRVLLSAIGYTFSLVFATQGVVNSYSELRRAATALGRVQHVLATSSPDSSLNSLLPPGTWWNLANGQGSHGDGTAPAAGTTMVQERASNAAVEAARAGDLKLVQVRFAYPRRPELPVLNSLDLTLHRGSVTALVGRSGAGKSTVAALVSRFYEPQTGQLRLGDRPAESFSRGEWARAVSVVSQEPVLFSGTIAENIAYSCSGHCSQSEIEEAAKVANAHDFIRELPRGYQTVVGPSGQLLSGGQRQRVAIARALLKNSPIIILDEATSALDAVSERLVQDAIERLVQGKTVLVIAHRLSTVQRADRIVVLKDGVVAEDGSHEELVAKGGVYAELVNAQTLTLSTC